MSVLELRPARLDDAPRLQAIRQAAFAPIFASFRALLGDDIYDLAQRRHDESQEGLLAGLITGTPGWSLYVAELGDQTIGFVALQIDAETGVGEIGLNAVAPEHAGRGFGSTMYRFALEQLKRAGMQVAVVGTGGDPSHAPARRAYQKAGFDAQVPSVWMCRKL